MTTFKLIDADDLDYEAFANLQREAYKELLEDLEFSDIYMSPQFYQWKFHPPAGTAKIVLVYEGDQLVSTNAMIPLDICFKKQIICGWQAADAATLVNARRKGYSSKCLRLLLDSLRNNEVLFLYPNKTSFRYVNAMGFFNKGVITTWIKPVTLLKKRISPNVIKVSRFDKAQDILANHLTSFNNVMLLRSSDYLNWRYLDHPIYKYICFIYHEGSKQKGFSVVRNVDALGRNVALIMELWSLTFSVKRALIRSIAKWANELLIRWIVLQDNNLTILDSLKMGFISAPTFLLPKKQVLMVNATPGKHSDEVINNDWWAQIGDWDGL